MRTCTSTGQEHGRRPQIGYIVVVGTVGARSLVLTETWEEFLQPESSSQTGLHLFLLMLETQKTVDYQGTSLTSSQCCNVVTPPVTPETAKV